MPCRSGRAFNRQVYGHADFCPEEHGKHSLSEVVLSDGEDSYSCQILLSLLEAIPC